MLPFTHSIQICLNSFVLSRWQLVLQQICERADKVAECRLVWICYITAAMMKIPFRERGNPLLGNETQVPKCENCHRLAIIDVTISQIPQCTSFIYHNAPFRTEMCTFLFWMVHCGIWNWCIVGFFNWVDWVHNRVNECTNYGWGIWIIVACRVIMIRARETDDWSHRQPALNITISFEPKQAKGKNANLNIFYLRISHN